MSSNLPPPARTAGGARLPAPYKGHAKEDADAPATPQTNVEQALSAQSQQEILQDALGIPRDNETPTVRDAAEHPKANASTYQPGGNRQLHEKPHDKHRSNAGNHVAGQVHQPGGAYGAHRH